MNEAAKLRAISCALYSTKDIIETLDRPRYTYGYDDFATPELRDMFYQLNDMCITLSCMRDALEENGEG